MSLDLSMWLSAIQVVICGFLVWWHARARQRLKRITPQEVPELPIEDFSAAKTLSILASEILIIAFALAFLCSFPGHWAETARDHLLHPLLTLAFILFMLIYKIGGTMRPHGLRVSHFAGVIKNTPST